MSNNSELQLHCATLHYNYGCTTPHDIQQSCWREGPDSHSNHCKQSKETQLQPPFSQSVDWLCHPCLTTTNLSYRSPILKLLPPPCAVLLVQSIYHSISIWMILREAVLGEMGFHMFLLRRFKGIAGVMSPSYHHFSEELPTRSSFYHLSRNAVYLL